MLTRLPTSVLFFVFIAAAMWQGSLRVYDAEKMSDALKWRWAELNDEPVFSWQFEMPDEIFWPHGDDSFRWGGGVLRGNHDDPYFYLNLEGRMIDASRFTELRIRMNSPAGGNLRLFHFQGRDDVIHASDFIPVAGGWQTLTLELSGLGWQSRNLVTPDSPIISSSWGGERGLVTALRLDPVENGAFQVDSVELTDPGYQLRRVEEINLFKGADDELFDRMREDPDRTWHVAQENNLRTPETAHRLRLKIAQQFPSAIVFPRPPADEDLAWPPIESGAATPYIPAVVFVIAVLVLVVRDQVGKPWKSLVAVVALITLLEAYIYWLPHLSASWRVLLAIVVLGAFWELVPRTAPTYLYLEVRTWLWVLPLLVVSLLILVWAGIAGRIDSSIFETLLVYFLWALVQQFVVAVLVMDRLNRVFGPAGLVLSAGVFGFLHFPNFALMCATFVLGVFLLTVYDRHRNLFAISAAHAFLAVSFNVFAEQYLWLSSLVGPGYIHGL